MRLLYFYEYFNTRDGEAGTRCYEFSTHLVSRGHDVTVITGSSEHADTTQDSFLEETWVDGIQVLRLGIPYSQAHGRLARIGSFLEYAILASLVQGRVPTPDVILATSTPLTAGIPGLLGSRRFQVPFVFEVRDLWPDVPIALGFLTDPVTTAAARRLERLLYRRADALIALSPGMKRGMVREGANPDRIAMIPNMADLALFSRPNVPSTWRETVGIPREAFVVVHTGALGLVNDLSQALEAAELLRESGIYFALVGKGNRAAELEERARVRGLDNVVFPGSYPRSQMPSILADCDVGFLPVRKNPVLYHNSANKFGDYLAAGLPVLVTYPGWQGVLLERYRAGLVAADGASDVAFRLLRLRDDRELQTQFRAGALRLAKERFSREKLAGQFEELLLQVVNGTQGGPRH